MSIKVIIYLIFAALVAIFTYQNQILIDIRFLQWEIINVPLAVILVIGIICGFFLDLVFQRAKIVRLKRELKKVVVDLKRSEKIEPIVDEKADAEGVSMGQEYKGGFFTE